MVSFVLSAVSTVLVSMGLFSGWLLPAPGISRLKRFLRPPGARDEAQFLSLCIRCGQCANVCPNKCISLHGLEAGFENLGTPKIDARARGCTLCMACTQVCPTEALVPIEATEAGMAAVAMGTAFVAEDICYSFHGRTCGACYHACPLPGKALTVGLFEKPTVHAEHCVGCGLCEQACIHMPQAIRVVPKSELQRLQRPPGAVIEADFLARCIHCQRCQDACDKGAIRLAVSGDRTYQGTPFILAADNACNMCLECTDTCPTGALLPIARKQDVNMGTAVVDGRTCVSIDGTGVCGACFTACPLRGKAITLDLYNQPIVHEEYCTGCGLCEEVCILKGVKAIRVFSNRGRRAA